MKMSWVNPWHCLPLYDWDSGLTFYAWALRQPKKKTIPLIMFSVDSEGPTGYATVQKRPKIIRQSSPPLSNYQKLALADFVKCNLEGLGEFWRWSITPKEFFTTLRNQFSTSVDAFLLTTLRPEETNLSVVLYAVSRASWKKPMIVVANGKEHDWSDIFRVTLEKTPKVVEQSAVAIPRPELDRVFLFVVQNQSILMRHWNLEADSFDLARDITALSPAAQGGRCQHKGALSKKTRKLRTPR